jgi:hypothetical protein
MVQNSNMVEPASQGLWLKFVLVIGAVLAPIEATVFAVGFLICSDFITGIMSSLKAKQKITSAKMSRTLVKMFLYQLAVLTAFVGQQYLLKDAVPVVNVVAGLIASTELLSCYENISYLTGIEFKDKLQMLLKPFKSDKDKRK